MRCSQSWTSWKKTDPSTIQRDVLEVFSKNTSLDSSKIRKITGKRYTVRWTKLGDESTKFFHAAATERYRIKTITSLESEDGRMVIDHLEKAALIWDEFRKRLGFLAHSKMQFNLAKLMQHHSLQ
jgi:hypothetical protein